MGKGDINIPEAYDLDELLEKQVQMNRFDATNPWGSQTWHQLEDGRFRMDQDVDERLETAVNKNIAMANRDAPQYRMMPAMNQNFNAMFGQMAERAGMPEMQNMTGHSGGNKLQMQKNAQQPDLPQPEQAAPQPQPQPAPQPAPAQPAPAQPVAGPVRGNENMRPHVANQGVM